MQRPDTAYWLVLGAFVSGCTPTMADTLDTGDAMITDQAVACDPIAEQWELSASVVFSNDHTAVTAVFNEDETHPLTLRWRDIDSGAAEYAAELDIVPTGPIDLGRTTMWSCNDAADVYFWVADDSR